MAEEKNGVRPEDLSMTTGKRIRAMCLAGLEGMCNLSNV